MRFFKEKGKSPPPQLSERVKDGGIPGVVELSSLIDLALETWRVRERCRRLQVTLEKEDPAIDFSIEKMQHILKEMGIEVKDPTGEPYHEGMGLDVLTFDYGSDERPENRVVQETVSPAIYFNGKLMKMAKVIVGIAGGRDAHAQNHD